MRSMTNKNINPERCRLLGEFGEYILAENLLKRNGFKEIRNLNSEHKTNQPFADIYAERDGKKYVISVKARNKFEKSGKLNSRYKLGENCYKNAEIVSTEFDATAAFLAISFEADKQTYSGYFGELAILKGNKGVPVGEKHLSNYECLGKDIKSDINLSKLKNTY